MNVPISLQASFRSTSFPRLIAFRSASHLVAHDLGHAACLAQPLTPTWTYVIVKATGQVYIHANRTILKEGL